MHSELTLSWGVKERYLLARLREERCYLEWKKTGPAVLREWERRREEGEEGWQRAGVEVKELKGGRGVAVHSTHKWADRREGRQQRRILKQMILPPHLNEGKATLSPFLSPSPSASLPSLFPFPSLGTRFGGTYAYHSL